MKFSKAYLTIVILIVFAAITRLLPHPFNFTAIGAMALLCGANIKDKRIAFLLPFIVMFLTDLVIGFHASMIPVYGCFAIAVWIGTRIRSNQNIFRIISASIFSSIVFFLVTNLPFWYADIKLYPSTFQGTFESYKMAIPFFRNQLAGDLFYSILLFEIYHLVTEGKFFIFNAGSTLTKK